MFSTIHGTVGAMIGQSSGNIWLAFFGGIIAHFLFDAIPHGDEKLVADVANPTKKEMLKVMLIALTDGIIMLFILTALWYFGKMPADWVVLSGVIGGILPDINTACYFLSRRCPVFKPMLDLHFKFHRLFIRFEMTLWQGIILQIIIEGLLIGLLLL